MFVKRRDGRASDSVPPDPEFGLVAMRNMRLPATLLGRATADHLAGRIARNRHDLVAHVRRIWLHHDLHDAANVAAAVIDLLIALEDKGSEIRRRMLQGFAADLLTAGCRLPDEVMDGAPLARSHPSTAWPGALLARPIRGSLHFVTEAQGEDSIRQADAPQSTDDANGRHEP